MNLVELQKILDAVASGQMDTAAAMKTVSAQVKADIEVEFTYDRDRGEILLGGMKKGRKYGLTPEQWEKVRDFCGLVSKEDKLSYDEAQDTLGKLIADVRANTVPESAIEPKKDEKEEKADAAAAAK